MDRIQSWRHNHLGSFVTLVLLGAASLLTIGVGRAGATGWIGVSVQDITREIAEAMNLPAGEGALVSEVVRGGPAEDAGLQARDVITQIDSEKVASAAGLVDYLKERTPGDRVILHVMRDGVGRTIEIRLGEPPRSRFEQSPAWESPDSIRQQTERERRPLPELRMAGWRLGIRVTPLDRNLAPYFQAEPGRGVLVIGVVPDSPGEAAGIRSGDVILKLDGTEVTDVVALRDRVGSLKEGDEFSIEVLRKGRITRIHGTVTARMTTPNPRDIRRPRGPLAPGIGWNRQREMIWGHNQLQNLERKMQELQRKIEDLSERLERLQEKRSR